MCPARDTLLIPAFPSPSLAFYFLSAARYFTQKPDRFRNGFSAFGGNSVTSRILACASDSFPTCYNGGKGKPAEDSQAHTCGQVNGFDPRSSLGFYSAQERPRSSFSSGVAGDRVRMRPFALPSITPADQPYQSICIGFGVKPLLVRSNINPIRPILIKDFAILGWGSVSGFILGSQYVSGFRPVPCRPPVTLVNRIRERAKAADFADPSSDGNRDRRVGPARAGVRSRFGLGWLDRTKRLDWPRLFASAAHKSPMKRRPSIGDSLGIPSTPS
ncbi:hypothetical protein H6P81_005114 [Aristolochia fimbriata]|uniref:Uncharacterized protein n=1 Tax=Aristolochia fimbriata TaxID=158543 RepID=A0AAV7ETJ7_ARIFI|nr:hypothetical protein H6P81_005114 [Aristolochia fimbriata]